MMMQLSHSLFTASQLLGVVFMLIKTGKKIHSKSDRHNNHDLDGGKKVLEVNDCSTH